MPEIVRAVRMWREFRERAHPTYRRPDVYAAAVEYIKKNKADLLVFDMTMDPGIDGLETYKQIITINPDQKALIASGFSETEKVKEAQKLGAGEYIKKFGCKLRNSSSSSFVRKRRYFDQQHRAGGMAGGSRIV